MSINYYNNVNHHYYNLPLHGAKPMAASDPKPRRERACCDRRAECVPSVSPADSVPLYYAILYYTML